MNWLAKLRARRKLKMDMELLRDASIYGTAYILEVRRKAWNPLRWVLGDTKWKRLDPRRMYIHRGGR